MEGLMGFVITVGVIVTILFLVMRVKKGGLPAMFIKAGASACFIGTAFVAYAYNIEKNGYTKERFEYGILMLLGFIFSLLGDVCLPEALIANTFVIGTSETGKNGTYRVYMTVNK